LFFSSSCFFPSVVFFIFIFFYFINQKWLAGWVAALHMLYFVWAGFIFIFVALFRT